MNFRDLKIVQLEWWLPSPSCLTINSSYKCFFFVLYIHSFPSISYYSHTYSSPCHLISSWLSWLLSDLFPESKCFASTHTIIHLNYPPIRLIFTKLFFIHYFYSRTLYGSSVPNLLACHSRKFTLGPNLPYQTAPISHQRYSSSGAIMA